MVRIIMRAILSALHRDPRASGTANHGPYACPTNPVWERDRTIARPESKRTPTPGSTRGLKSWRQTPRRQSPIPRVSTKRSPAEYLALEVEDYSPGLSVRRHPRFRPIPEPIAWPRPRLTPAAVARAEPSAVAPAPASERESASAAPGSDSAEWAEWAESAARASAGSASAGPV